MDNTLIEGLNEEQIKEVVAEAAAEIERRRKYRMIDFFIPNPFQRDFFEAGLMYRYRFLSGGTQSGKSLCAGVEFTFHMRGEYPKWWKGRRFTEPITALVVGIDKEQSRGAGQRILLGEGKEDLGTGTIPKDWIKEVTWDKDENSCVDFLVVPHVSGGLSYAYFVTQGMGHKKFQGRPIHLIWGDESITELNFLLQFLSRITSTDGMIMLTACPEEMGYTEIYQYFDPANPERPPQAWYREASLLEVTHLSKERIQEVINSFPAHVRPYKIHGKPVFGKGMVYPFNESELKCEPFRIESDWLRIAGKDFGYAHSLDVTVWLAINPYDGTVYVYDVYSTRQATPEMIVPHIKARDREAGFDIPVAYPRDGNCPERSTGNVIAEIYRELGVNMLDGPAIMEGADGKKTYSVEAGITLITQLMHAGKFKIFYQKVITHDGVEMPDMKMEPIFQEMRSYVRGDDGQPKKSLNKDPHHWDAIRYAVMCKDQAISGDFRRKSMVKVAGISNRFVASMAN